MRKIFSLFLKFLIAISSLVGVLLACIFAQRDGYSHWIRRMLYFTQQSNIWLGVTCLIIAVLTIIGMATKKHTIKNYMYVLKYFFTVSITLTGIIFCVVLAPLADFNVWTLSGVLTHVVSPVLAIVDLFVDDYSYSLKKSHVFASLIPPLAWFSVASVLCVLKVDFGRGNPYPYFFMNYFSPVGLFGFKNGKIPQIGSVYWIVFIFFLITFISWIYYKFCKTKKQN